MSISFHFFAYGVHYFFAKVLTKGAPQSHVSAIESKQNSKASLRKSCTHSADCENCRMLRTLNRNLSWSCVRTWSTSSSSKWVLLKDRLPLVEGQVVPKGPLFDPYPGRHRQCNPTVTGRVFFLSLCPRNFISSMVTNIGIWPSVKPESKVGEMLKNCRKDPCRYGQGLSGLGTESRRHMVWP